MKTVMIGFAIMLTIVATAFVASRVLLNKLAFFPDAVGVRAADQLPRGVEIRPLKLADGVVLANLYLTAPESAQLLIYFHGNAGNIFQRLPSLLVLREAGVNVLGVSYRGYGGSTGTPSETGLYEDGEAVWQYATKSLNFAPENIFILGRSIGSAVAVNTAQNKNFAGLILIAPLASGVRQAQHMGLGMISFFANGRFDNLAKANLILAPTLLVHGDSDEVVPYSSGVELFEKILAVKQLITIEGGDHNNLQDQFPNQFWTPIVEFIRYRNN